MGIAAIAHLEAAIDDVRALDFDALTDDEVEDVMIGTARARCSLLVPSALATREFHQRGLWRSDGSKASWARLSRDANLSPTEAKAEVRRARQLPGMPLAAAALAAGRISAAHLDLLAKANQPSRREAFARDEARLVEWCTGLRYSQARQKVLEWCQEVDPDGCERIGRHLLEKTSLTAVTTFEDSVYVNGLLDPIGGAMFLRALRRIERDLYRADRREGRERSATQRRAAAMVEMAIRAHTAPKDGQRPEPLLLILAGTGTTSRLCQLSTGAVVSPTVVAPYLSESQVQSFVYSDATHIVHASEQRTFRGWIRRAVQARDRHCQHPSGCDEPIEHCDVDHILPDARGGLTSVENGRLQCTTHNRDPRLHDRAPPGR